MEHSVRVCPDASALAGAAAEHVAQRAAAAIAQRGRFHLALSGGSTPWAMLERLHGTDLDWGAVVIHQVDERFAPDGDDDRNLTHLMGALQGMEATVVPMGTAVSMDGGVPESDAEVWAAADSYAATLPERFDLVHLGLGEDGHTASLVPGDPVLDETVRLVGCTQAYRGRRRMTLTYRGLARAESIMWLVAGAAKARALAALLAGDTSIPAARVVAPESVLFVDSAAAGRDAALTGHPG